MGDICNGVFQLGISLKKAAAFSAQPAKLRINGRGQPAHGTVPAGNINQRICTGREPVGEAFFYFPRRFLQQIYFCQ